MKELLFLVNCSLLYDIDSEILLHYNFWKDLNLSITLFVKQFFKRKNIINYDKIYNIWINNNLPINEFPKNIIHNLINLNYNKIKLLI